MNPNEPSFVIKYFDLIDEFIRVRCCSEEVLTALLTAPITNKASYRRRIVECCVPSSEVDVLGAITRLDEEYDLEIVEELLYQICIDVNPSLEIHQVSIPAPDGSPDNHKERDLLPLPEVAMANFHRKAMGLERSLRAQVVGQEGAIATLVRSVKKAAVGLKRPEVPVGTFLFVGRTGTGKTELAKALARSLFDDPGHLIRIDCSEYALPHEYAKLIGSPPGYIGHNEGGYLTESVKAKKQCVILFDEVEKAHQKVHNLLLQILDEGRLTDSKGQVIDFSQCMVILTSNLGIEKLDQLCSRMGFRTGDDMTRVAQDDIKNVTMEALKECFRPEFINRIDEVVLFNNLDIKVCARIAARMLREMAGLLGRSGIVVSFSAGVRNALARKGFSEEYGARELRRLIKRKIEDPVTELILDRGLAHGDSIHVRVQRGEPVFELGGAKITTANA